MTTNCFNQDFSGLEEKGQLFVIYDQLVFAGKFMTASAGLNSQVIFKIDNIPISLLCPLYICTMMQISSTLVFLPSICLSVCCCCFFFELIVFFYFLHHADAVR